MKQLLSKFFFFAILLVLVVPLCVQAQPTEIVLYQSSYIKGKEKPRQKKVGNQFVVPPIVESLRIFLRTTEGNKGNAATVFIDGTMVGFSEDGEATVSLGGNRMEKVKSGAMREGKMVASRPDVKTIEVNVHGSDGNSVNLVVVGVINPSSIPGMSGR